MILRFGAIALLSWFISSVRSTQYTVDNAPTIPNSDSIQFFYLESPFPFNAPNSIVNAAGSNYNNYGISHAGLGVWDSTTGDKYSIEFVSTNYVGGLLPSTSGGSLSWQNAGEIVITYPLDDNVWLNSRLIATTSGSAYSQLITYLQGVGSKYSTYQPITAMYVNGSSFNATNFEAQSNDISSFGTVLVSAVDSFAFVDDLINQLSTYGTDLGAFLTIYATSFDYFTASKTSISTVSWSSTADTNYAAVLQWYTDLNHCYSTTFDASKSAGAQTFLNGIKLCYGSYAYVYLSETSVYNITLANFTAQYSSPYQGSYAYVLPGNNTGKRESLRIADYVIIALVFVSIVVCIAVALHRTCTKKMRRRISFEGERMAQRTVESMTDTQEDHHYFHGKDYGGGRRSQGGGSWFGRGSANSNGIETNPMSIGNSPAI